VLLAGRELIAGSGFAGVSRDKVVLILVEQGKAWDATRDA